MTVPRIIAYLAALLAVPVWANAQDIPLRPDLTSSCRFDSTSIRDTIDFTLFLTPPRSVAKARSKREQYTPYISAIASTFTQPPRLSISYWPGRWADEQIAGKGSVGDCDAWCTAGPLEGEVQFRFRKGRVTDVSWWLVPDSPEVMRALEHAIRQADSLGLFPKSHHVAGLPKGVIRLAMRLARWPPTLGGMAIGHVRLPHVRVTRPVGIIFQPTPHFPGSAGEFGLTGTVSLQYIVGEFGRVSEGSIRVLEADQPVFIQPAVRAIAGSRFRPAQAGGCLIRYWVHQRVVFRR